MKRYGADLSRAGEAGSAARAEVAMIDRAIGERTAARMAALRTDPPAWITAELGECPSDPARRRTWESAAREVVSYRMEHGVSDRDTAFGPEPEVGAARVSRAFAERSLQRARRELGLEQARVRDRAIEMGPEL